MKSDLRISVKDYQRNKTLKIELVRAPFGTRQFWVRTRRRCALARQVNGERWPKDARPVSLTRVLTGLRKALVKSASQPVG
jgi:hypothetical protein